MKRLFTVLVVVAIAFSAGFAFAEEKEAEMKWRIIGDVSVGIFNKDTDKYTGEILNNNPVSKQLATLGAEKDSTGFYVQGENITPFERKESKETDLSLGAYADVYGMGIDGGYTHCFIREKGEPNSSEFYGSVNFPKILGKITPFVRMKYVISAEKTEDEDGNMVSLKGFTYRIGFNRDFNITEKVILNVELASGGNTGIYDYPPENLAFVQGQVKGSIDFKNNISLKPEVSYQRNIGRKDGIASRSDNEWIIGAWIVWTF